MGLFAQERAVWTIYQSACGRSQVHAALYFNNKIATATRMFYCIPVAIGDSFELSDIMSKTLQASCRNRALSEEHQTVRLFVEFASQFVPVFSMELPHELASLVQPVKRLAIPSSPEPPALCSRGFERASGSPYRVYRHAGGEILNVAYTIAVEAPSSVVAHVKLGLFIDLISAGPGIHEPWLRSAASGARHSYNWEAQFFSPDVSSLRHLASARTTTRKRFQRSNFIRISKRFADAQYPDEKKPETYLRFSWTASNG